MLTTGEAISAAGKYAVNQGAASVETSVPFREKAAFYLTTIAKKVWGLAPWWWRLATSGSVSVTTSSGTMPADFSAMGTHGQVYNALGNLIEFCEPGAFYALRLAEPNVTATYPRCWTLGGKTALGLTTIQVHPAVSAATTLQVRAYEKRLPDLIDRPMAPSAVDQGGAGNPDGTYTYKVTYVNALGETEPSAASTSVTVATNKITVTIPVSANRSVTARKLYRTAASGTTYKLVATISDNTTTTYVDDVADGSLGTTAPLITEAVTGFEIFPEDMQESVLVEGLIARFERSQDDKKAATDEIGFENAIKRAWANFAQGKNTNFIMPAFGEPSYANAGRSLRDRLMGN